VHMRPLLILMVVSMPLQAMSVSDMACGAKICLSGDGGSPCAPFLDKYNSINGATSAITKRLKKAFLAKCKEQEPPDLEYLGPAAEAELNKTDQLLEKDYDELFTRMRKDAGIEGMDSTDTDNP